MNLAKEDYINILNYYNGTTLPLISWLGYFISNILGISSIASPGFRGAEDLMIPNFISNWYDKVRRQIS